jgi:hypothetical protein
MAEKHIIFQANFSCFVGNRGIIVGEGLIANETKNGTYILYYLDPPNDEPIAWLNPDDINKLAGHAITRE